jgi:hypothetical protein
MSLIPAELEARFAEAVEHKNALVRGSRPQGSVEWARYNRDVAAAKTTIAGLYREAARLVGPSASPSGGIVWLALLDAADALEDAAREHVERAVEREQRAAEGGAS